MGKRSAPKDRKAAGVKATKPARPKAAVRTGKKPAVPAKPGKRAVAKSLPTKPAKPTVVAPAAAAARGPKDVNFQVTLSTDTSLLFVCDPTRLKHRTRDKLTWWQDNRSLHQEAQRGHLIPVHTGADGIFNLRVTTGKLTARESEFKEEERTGFWLDLRSGILLLAAGEDMPGEGSPLTEEKEHETRLRGGRYAATITRIEEIDDDLPTYVVRLTPMSATERVPELPPPISNELDGDQETDFERAEKLFEQGKVKEAERVCTSHLSRDTDEHSYDFRTLRAKCRRLEGDLDGAYQDITAAIDDFAFGERLAEYARILYDRGEQEQAMDVALWAILDNFNEYPLVLEVRALRMGWLVAHKRLAEAYVHMGAVREDRTIMSPRSEPKLFLEIDRLRNRIRITEKPKFDHGAPVLETPEEDLVGTIRHKLEINADKPWKQMELLMIGARLGGPKSEFRKERDDLAAKLIKVRK